MSQSEYRNWRLEHDIDGICWLTIDRPGETANSLSRGVFTELGAIIAELEKKPPRGLVLQSGKNRSFIVGADVREFDEVTSAAEAEAFIRFCYRRRAVQWPELYDEMCAVAARGDYRGMQYEELSRLGIGFALSSLPRLAQLAARVIAQERGPQRIAAVA